MIIWMHTEIYIQKSAHVLSRQPSTQHIRTRELVTIHLCFLWNRTNARSMRCAPYIFADPRTTACDGDTYQTPVEIQYISVVDLIMFVRGCFVYATVDRSCFLSCLSSNSDWCWRLRRAPVRPMCLHIVVPCGLAISYKMYRGALMWIVCACECPATFI